ncbi:hypothetical protein [Pedobacter sp. P26]|uniref:hypothetical protein n=1 Tax=Pedobacter sp. P26 TaxID=3423956 RepID=UPI003D66E9BE
MKIIIKICFLSLLIVLSVGCKKSKQTESLIGGDLKIVLLGELIPRSVAMDKNSIATVSFVGSDRNYRFDLNRVDANSYWGRLVNAQKNSTPVKVYVTKQIEIVRVE